MFLLDTNACIHFLNGTRSRLVTEIRKRGPGQVRLCSIVKAELLFGARRSSRPAQNLDLLERFFAPFVSLPFDDPSAERYGVLRSELERLGTPVGPFDMAIASIAIVHELVLVTHNTREFSRIPNLRLADWEV